ncbi:MAG: ABC transporter ATP-binding protein [Chloroflexota bacterium]
MSTSAAPELTAPEPVEPLGTRGEAAALVGVTRRFDDVTVLRDVSLAVRPGELVGIIGPSGAGKTTAVRILTGAIRPTEGTARVLGEDPTRLSPRARERIGFMPQHMALYEDLTAGENLDFVASLFGLLWFRRRRRIREILQLFELWDVRGRRAGALSGGMQRRVQLAAALIHQPELVFLDEPTAGIDPILRQTIWSELRRRRDQGTTLLVTTQQIAEAEECDSVALIAHGRVAAFAPPEALRRQAFGGEVLEVETEGIIDAPTLASEAIVGSVRQVGPRTIHVVVEDAASAIPAIIEAVESSGGAVGSIREFRPSFDQVFAALVEDARNDPAPDAAS